MNKKILAAIIASVMVTASLTACGSSKKDSKPDTSSSQAEKNIEPEEQEESSADENEAPAETAAPDNAPSEFEEPVVAQSGDAILAITDKDWKAQYWGSADDILTYNAGVAHINGDGDYTVSVTAATKGAQFDLSGNADGDTKINGLSFSCIKVIDGTKLYPNMSIAIKEIRVDGTPLALSAKNYTSTDDNIEMRANIYNNYISTLPADAHTADGPVSGPFGEYSSMIVNPDDFASWSTVEVDFTVTGTGAGGDAAPAAESEAAEGEAAEGEAAETEAPAE